MDPELQALGIQLAAVAARNTASAIADRIRAAFAGNKDRETITELEEIVSGLQTDKNELLRIAHAYEQELVAQRISEADIEYISEHIVPLITQLTEKAVTEQGGDTASAQAIIELIKPILSVETVTILQLVGFNFKRAVGEPLTELVATLIASQNRLTQVASQELALLAAKREVAYLEIARDPEAWARLTTFHQNQ